MYNNEFPEKINMDDLYNQRRITEDFKIKSYKRILGRVHNKIKHTSRMRNNNQFCFFLLPEFVLGVPRYDMSTCTSYIIEKLLDNGFQVKYTHPNLLFISWQHWIPHYKRAQIKKHTGVSIDGFGNVVHNKERNLKSDKGNMNNLLLKNSPYASSKNLVIKKKDSKNYKEISSYKPTGALIYDSSLIKRIENSVTPIKNP